MARRRRRGFAGLDHQTTVLAARKRAYECGMVTGGSVLSPGQAKDLLEADARDPMPTIKNWSTTPWERRRLVCPIDVDVPALQARALREQQEASSKL